MKTYKERTEDILARAEGMKQRSRRITLISVLAVCLLYTDVVKASSSSIVTAEHASYDLPVLFCHYTGRRIPLQETFHTLS